MKKYIVGSLVSLSIMINATAGAVFGPYVVWINMAENNDIDRRAEKYLNSGKDDCWNDRALMFMRSKPSDLTAELLDNAIFSKNEKSIRKLNAILRRPFGEADEGFDGIIVYSEKGGRFLYKLVVGEKSFKKIKLGSDLEKGICAAMPDIIRKP